MKRTFQLATPPAQQPYRHGEGMTPFLKPLTERAAAEHCGYFDRGLRDPVGAFQKWARRKGIPVKVASRARLYDPRVLEAFLTREGWTLRHASVSLESKRHAGVVRHAPRVAAVSPSRKGEACSR